MKSAKNVLRYLHYQFGQPQEKLVRVLPGSIYDVVVDLRRSSPSFGQRSGAKISVENMRQISVPALFAGGFMFISETAECTSKPTTYWVPEYVRSILCNNLGLNIKRPLTAARIHSTKDSMWPLLADAKSFA